MVVVEAVLPSGHRSNFCKDRKTRVADNRQQPAFVFALRTGYAQKHFQLFADPGDDSSSEETTVPTDVTLSTINNIAQT